MRKKYIMKNKANCFIDFDGTIICNKRRLYKFFIDNIDNAYVKSITIKEFWNLKRMGINEIDWVNDKYDSLINKKTWNELKKKHIEDKEYLKFNKLFAYSVNAIDKIKSIYNLILVTRRSNKENFLSELKNYKIEKIFDDILIINHSDNGKADIIKKNYNVSNNDIIIGDTEDDLKAAVDLNIVGIFVKSGVRSEWIINRYFKNYAKILCFDNIDKIDFDKTNLLNRSLNYKL